MAIRFSKNRRRLNFVTLMMSEIKNRPGDEMMAYAKVRNRLLFATSKQSIFYELDITMILNDIFTFMILTLPNNSIRIYIMNKKCLFIHFKHCSKIYSYCKKYI